MTFLSTTSGCKLNFAESSALAKALVARGHTRAAKGTQPDLCVINTCSVTDAADHKDRQAIRRLRRLYPNAILIVTGCYAQLKPTEIAHIEGVDYILGQNEKFNLDEFVQTLENQKSPISNLQSQIFTSAIREVEDFHGAYSKDDRTRCFLKVQDGCNYFCTYCTIPLARGKSRNPGIADLVRQANEALHQGAKEIVLSGVNIGDFGHSTGETFIDLLRALDQLNADEYRIRISSCEPNLLSDEIIDFVAHSHHFAPHFHIPLQSGSNEVLRIMKRRYTRELFAERVEHIRRVMPNAFIGVDCMVGVRGETDECWEDYLQFIQSLPVSQLHVFTYSERANTRMLEMDLYVVPQKERERRSQILHRVSEEKLKAFYEAHKGEEATVLWEAGETNGQDPLDGSKLIMAGWTENYIRTTMSPFDPKRVNTFERIRI